MKDRLKRFWNGLTPFDRILFKVCMVVWVSGFVIGLACLVG